MAFAPARGRAAAEAVTSPVGVCFGSSRGSASACRALEAEPAGSARSSSGVTRAWSAEVSPTLAPAPPAPFGNGLVAGGQACHHPPVRWDTPPGAAPPVLPASAPVSLGSEGGRHVGVCPPGFWCLQGWEAQQEPNLALAGPIIGNKPLCVETNSPLTIKLLCSQVSWCGKKTQVFGFENWSREVSFAF